MGLNKQRKILYTSDNPVIRKGHLNHSVFGSTGLASPGVEIAYPISPRHIIVMYERSAWVSVDVSDGNTILLEEGQVDYYNSFQVKQSYRYVYSTSDDFSLAKDVCNRIPRVRDPFRARVIF